MPRPTLSVVVPTRDDFYGAWNTVMSLLDHHGEQIDEILVVDNGPQASEDSALLKDQFRSLKKVRIDRILGPESSCRYKDRGIRLAASELVICCDSHVLFPTQPVDAIGAALNWFAAHPDSNDLVMGPCCKQSGQVNGTNQMLYAWEADRLHSPAIPADAQVLSGVVCRGGNLGAWVTDPRGLDPTGEAFEIQQQGTGAFCVRRSAWPGWPPTFNGHGGNETYLMEAIRRRGGRVLCLPGFRWTHNFGRTHKWTIDGKPSKVPYRMNWDNKAANYLSGFAALDLPRLWDAASGHLQSVCPRTIQKLVRQYPRPRGLRDLLVPTWHAAGGDTAGAIPLPLFDELRRRIRPGMSTLEFGAGLSTLLFDAVGCLHTAIEHDLTWYERVRGRLSRPTTRMIASHIAEGHDGERWYDWRPGPEEQYDLILIDGPPGQRSTDPGRAGCRHYLADIMAPAATILIDDTHRPAECRLSADLAAMYGFRVEHRPCGSGRAFDVLTRSADSTVYERGVGTEVKRILRERWSISASASCGCNGRVREMNYRGVEWCRHNVDTIVGWLQDGAEKWKATSQGIAVTWVSLVPAFAERLYLRRLVEEAIRATDSGTSTTIFEAKAA